jgi:7,8-dihydropterin-6-yl-methyl-4-(beta-D-ribofuranosyl)aminobenzene 5'-phosphate synthase
LSIDQVAQVTITILMDNFTDLLLANSANAKRQPLIMNEKIKLPPPIAEHGFSALVHIDKVNQDGIDTNLRGCSFLFDAGVSENGVSINADRLGIDLEHIDGIILSHGHFDHFTGLHSIIKKIRSKRSDFIMNLYTHPDAFLRRWLVLPDGKRARMPVLDEKQLEQLGVKVQKDSSVKILPGDNNPLFLITGEIPRETIFEKGFPFQHAEELNGKKLRHDPLVKDDQALVANVKNKGLVILTACGHSGIINTIKYAKRITGIDKIHAIIGGFHLPSGGIYEDAIEPTIEELLKSNTDHIIPCHCTGWKAINRIIEAFGEKFIPTSVGTTFTF